MLILIILVSGCAYTVQPTQYSSVSSLVAAMGKNTGFLTSMKALASVSIHANGRGAEFPEGIVLDGDAMRLETLNIFYQPVLIIVCNDGVAVMDVGTGACGISPAGMLDRYTRVDAEPVLFERLITGRLIGKPDSVSGAGSGPTLSGVHDGTRWTAELDGELHVVSMTVRQGRPDQILCRYSDYATVDGAALPMRVACRSANTRISLHYRKARVNVPIAPALMDAQGLCSAGHGEGR
ncbi:MAG: hypothetical protein M1491_03220 [Deltaproteobacteria bacterium]|nr:hypothetical protein [Deltaproteobacteria bacterium]MCL5277378.1 hypothetical protein [Deltaproteobacteria bacterium]